nr:hypothetical protein BaRGS_012282 [Batillaria attramentaria]
MAEYSNGTVRIADDNLGTQNATKRRSPPPSYGAINRTWADNPDNHPFYHSDEALLPTFLYFMALYTTTPLTTFYLNDRLHEEYGVPNTTASCTANESSTGIMNVVQKKQTDYNMYLNFLSNFPAFLPAMFMGSVSDRYGRKMAIYMVSLATLLKNGVYALVFHYRWPIEYMYIGNALEGFSGSYGTFLMGIYGVVADVTSASGARGFKITCVQAAIAVALSAGMTLTGYWIEASGYMQPILFAAGVQAFNILFVLLFLPNTMPARVTTPLSCSAVLESIRVFTKATATKRRSILFLTLLAFGLGIYNLVAYINIVILYLLNFPFCWSTTHITFYNGACTLAAWVVVISIIGLFGRVVRDDVFALVGALSGIALFLVTGMAKTASMMYIAGACGVLSNLAMPMLRTILSEAVEAHEQGEAEMGTED